MGMTAQLSTVSWWLCGVDKRQAFSSERLLQSFFSTLLFIFTKLLGNLCFRRTYFSVKYGYVIGLWILSSMWYT